MTKFNHLFQEYLPQLQKVNEIILSYSAGKASLIQEITANLINSGGKRIRPILLIIATELCRDNHPQPQSTSPDNSVKYFLASAVEMIHSATLLHDDVVDNSAIRRGKKTANAIWDNKAPILVGDYLFSLAFQLMVKSDNLRILELLAKTSSIIADGEVLQLQNSTNINLSSEQYFEIIFGKTAVLFSACCEVGALINNRPEAEILALRNFGKNLGLVFQITDDILDYSSDSQTLGKEIGDDFFEAKVTLPIIKTYQHANNDDKKLINDIFQHNLISSEKNFDNFAKILDLINKYHGIELAKEMASDLVAQAQNNLKIFGENSYKDHLLSILEYSHHRIF